MRFSVYVENKVGEESPYFVTEAAVLRALGEAARDADVTVFSQTDPDLEQLGRARYFIGSGFDPQRIRNYARSVRIVHCTSAGVEKYMPLDWLPDGAALTNSSGVHAEKGGVFGAMTVLMLCEEVPRHLGNQRDRRWDSRLSARISKKTVLIYGFGALGSAIAERLKPFGPRIIGVSRSGRPSEFADETHAASALHDLLPRVDCLVLSCPLTPETRGVIGATEIGLMKPGASVFNIARAGVLDNAALVDALNSGHLGGAALDVFEQEPLPESSPLWDVPNLLIFPHISCDDADGYIDRCLEIFAENVRRDSAGLKLVNEVSADAGY
ncbi:D-2-hydroxyacid dehydrogenase [Sinorhizobium saheli]|uniref:D-2-hydroxyacid dehydrogenase n=1 Tax=Sinorhizobium saheli TaxID=36856 RepID=UPI000B075AB3|nr:D-2-hydroxyacid dehydrogenase [Sinorhizobium saheli]